jgi:hypothetical protein
LNWVIDLFKPFSCHEVKGNLEKLLGRAAFFPADATLDFVDRFFARLDFCNLIWSFALGPAATA